MYADAENYKKFQLSILINDDLIKTDVDQIIMSDITNKCSIGMQPSVIYNIVSIRSLFYGTATNDLKCDLARQAHYMKYGAVMR